MEPAISVRLKDDSKQMVSSDSEPINSSRVNASPLHAIMHLHNNGNTAVSEIPTKDGTDVMRFHMIREGGEWRISSVDIPAKDLQDLARGN